MYLSSNLILMSPFYLIRMDTYHNVNNENSFPARKLENSVGVLWKETFEKCLVLITVNVMVREPCELMKNCVLLSTAVLF